MEEDVFSIGQLINRTFANVSVDSVKKAKTTLDLWKSVLMKISSRRNPFEGANLVDHSRILDLKKDY